MYRYRSTHSDSDSDIVHRRGGRRLASFLDDLRSTYSGRRTRDRGTASHRGHVPGVAATSGNLPAPKRDDDGGTERAA